MKINYWKIAMPEGELLIENGYPTEIRMGDKLLSSRTKIIPPEIHEFDINGVGYKVKLGFDMNPFNNLGIKCSVERNGQLIADNPKQDGVHKQNLLILLLISAVVGFVAAIVTLKFFLGGAG